jgi:hypothetical protein
MYWLVLNLRSCFICVSDICGLVQNEFDDILSILVSLVHLWILGKFWARSVRMWRWYVFVGIFGSYE